MAPFSCPALLAETLPSLCRTIDIYCERTSDALDAEPANALTNLAMLIAAAAAARLQAKRPNREAAGLIWASILALIAGGIGAFLFHTTAAIWAVWADMVPFLIFMLLILWLTLTRFLGWSAIAAGAALAVFLAVTVGSGPLIPRGFLPGGVYYLMPILALAGSAAFLAYRRSAAAGSYAAATLVFVCAFAARQLDAPLCDVFPLGTHFVWHLLAALLAFILVRAAILYASGRGVA